MNLITIFSRFPTQEACIEHLESIRYRPDAYCPNCGSLAVARKADGDRVGRWNCHDCKSSFNVLAGTIFQKTKVPLQKWFLAIGLIVNAKKSLSSHQLARDLDLTQPTALYIQQRIRAAMAADQAPLLQGIVEADETYVGGRPRYPTRKRGRGTDKVPVLGVVERGGNVAAAVTEDVKGRSILSFIKANVEPSGSMLITDEFQAYRTIRRHMPHSVINHRRGWVDGLTHTNTIEGFWSLIKRAWYGSHHHYTKRFMPLFIAESCWKYNHRKTPDAFGSFLRGCFA